MSATSLSKKRMIEPSEYWTSAFPPAGHLRFHSCWIIWLLPTWYVCFLNWRQIRIYNNRLPSLTCTIFSQLIWSAACCSSASIGLFGSSDLLAKNKNGDIVKWSSSAVKWNHWTEASTAEGEAPLLRLSELLNVNHFIVSQANSYFIPFVSNQPNAQHDTLFHKLVYIIVSETRHRLFQVGIFFHCSLYIYCCRDLLTEIVKKLNQISLLPRVLRGVIEEKVSGDVTIVPSLSLKVICHAFNVSHITEAHALLYRILALCLPTLLSPCWVTGKSTSSKYADAWATLLLRRMTWTFYIAQDTEGRAVNVATHLINRSTL